MTQNLRAEIALTTYTKNFVDSDGTILLELAINSFEAELPQSAGAAQTINRFVLSQAEAFKQRAETRLLQDARQAVKNTLQHPFNPYEAFMASTVTYNDGLLSWYTDRYEYTGGAHGATTRSAATFRLSDGRAMSLTDFLTKPGDMDILLRNITAQAEIEESQNPSTYFPDYKQLLLQNFKPSQFYLSEDGVVVFYQEYAVAPHSSGIVDFIVPYDMF